jgi:hypothetical protein
MKQSTKKNNSATKESLIEYVIKTNGYLFPETVEEVIEFEKNFGTTNVILPEELDSTDFLYTEKSNSTILELNNKDNFAMAARNGKSVISEHILRRMEDDRNKHDE